MEHVVLGLISHAAREDESDPVMVNANRRIKEKREAEAKKDPKIPYFTFLEKRATPKLYWPEFRRK